MSERIKCSSCGAESYLSDKTVLHCHTCYEKLRTALREFADPDNWGINLRTGDLGWLGEKIAKPKEYAQEVLGITDEETEFPEEGR